jgi:peptidoglycan/LPS O-acetylase OafA/YrhL
MGERLGYRPALDGIRAVSIALVLVFHLGAPWLAGGYLGVSVFFTLSGFLITSLLLAERAGSGRIDIRAFYVRRLRRLLPASLVCITAIAVLAGAGVIAARSDLRAGVFGALAQVANWEHLLGNRSYADLFVSPSPVDHFWSLAIEEQFYWLWPLVMAGLLALAPRRSWIVLTGAFAVSGAGAFATARLLGGDAAYFASWARFAEILAGAALAAVLHGRRLPAMARQLALPSLIAIVALAVVTPAGRGWAYGGGLPLFAVLSATLIAGVSAGEGAVARVLALGPLAWVGRISYGLYLYHWPVFTILGDASVVAKIGLTVTLAVVSYYGIERPLRTGRVLPAPSTYVRGALAGALTAAVAVAVLVPVVHEERRSTEPVVITALSASAVAETTAPLPAPAASAAPATDEPAPAPVTAPPASPPPRVVALFGDSVADWLLRDAAPTFDRTDITLVDAAVAGCDGAADIPDARGRAGQLLPLPDDCREWPVAYPAAAENPALPLDVAVLVVGNAPMVDRNVDGRWVGPCDDMQWYVDDLDARVTYLRAHVGAVELALPSWGGDKASFLATDDHLERAACIRRELSALAARLAVPTVDLADVLCPLGPDGACTDLRERDGMHVDPEDAPFVLGWLLDRLPPR